MHKSCTWSLEDLEFAKRSALYNYVTVVKVDQVRSWMEILNLSVLRPS